MARQKLYNGCYLLGDGPCEANVSRIDHHAMPMLLHMMRTGMEVDLSHFASMEKSLTQDMDRISSEVQEIVGYHVNLDSGDQVSAMLFKDLGLKQARPKFTKSGDRESVEDEVLTAIQHDHPVVPLIQEFKEYSKLRGTYVQPMPKLAKRTAFGTWKLYPQLGHTRVPSGRLNCRSPNLLAMPTRTERGREIRKGFICKPGWVYLSVDLSQIEPRVVAYNSKDPNLVKVYTNEEDVYSDFSIEAFKLKDDRYKATGAEAAKLEAKRKSLWVYPSVDSDLHRRPSKTCVLAAIYDVTAKGLLEQLPSVCGNCGLEATKHTCSKFESLWTENKAQDLLNSFYMKYPLILRDRKVNHARARRNGYIWCGWGRTLHVAAVRSVLEWVVQAALREVGNFTAQSLAQGYLKIGMAQIQDDFVDMGLLGDVVDPVLQIHDEILSVVREDMAEEIGMHLIYRLERVCKFDDIPVKANMATAVSWGSVAK